MYVCKYVYVYVYAYNIIYMYIYVCMYVAYVCMHVCGNLKYFKSMYVNGQVITTHTYSKLIAGENEIVGHHTYMHTCIHIYIQYIHTVHEINLHSYIDTYIHTYNVGRSCVITNVVNEQPSKARPVEEASAPTAIHVPLVDFNSTTLTEPSQVLPIVCMYVS